MAETQPSSQAAQSEDELDSPGSISVSDDGSRQNVPDHQKTGMLIDFVRRLKKDGGKPRVREAGSNDATEDHLAILLSTKAQKILANQDFGDYGSYKGAFDIVRSEQLYHDMIEVFMPFFKELGDPEWVAPPAHELWQRAADIVKHKQEVHVLAAEVHSWLAKYNRKHHKYEGKHEDADDKLHRLQEFWAKFHSSPTKLPPSKLEAHSAGSDDEESDAGSPPGSPPHRNDFLVGTMSRLATQRRKPSWSSRAAKSRMPRAGWEFSRTLHAGLAAAADAPWPEESSCSSSVPASPALRKKTRLLDAYDDYLEEPNPPTPETERGHRVTCSSQIIRRFRVESYDPGGEQADTKVLAAGELPGMAKSGSLPSLNSRNAKRAARDKTGQRWWDTRVPGTIVEGKSDLRSEAGVGELPPIKDMHGSPWQHIGGGTSAKLQDSPTKRYLQVCRKEAVVPFPIPFVTGHSPKLRAKSAALADEDLMAVTTMLPSMERIEEVDLSDSSLFSDRALATMLHALRLNKEAARQVTKVSFARCRPVGLESIGCIIQLLHYPAILHSLRSLDLSSIQIATKCHMPLCEAISQHHALRSLSLMDTGLGRSPMLKQCVGGLVSSRFLQDLNLGWNCFPSDVFTLIGECLTRTRHLRKLGLSNCSAATKTHRQVTPVVYFIEKLTVDLPLSTLDLSLNRIDFRGALILEDALENNANLTELDVSHNPLGAVGMRSVLRLLARSRSGVTHINFDECALSMDERGDHGNAQPQEPVFSASRTAGRFALDLSRPYDRAFLRMLYKTCERFGLSHDAAFDRLEYYPGAYKHPEKDSQGNWMCASKGELKLTFSIEKAMEAGFENVDSGDFATVLTRHLSQVRVQPAFSKVIPMMAQWASSKSLQEQLVMLDALSKDFLLSLTHVAQLCKSRGLVGEIMAWLLPSLGTSSEVRYLALLHVPSISEYVKLLGRMKQLFAFNINNPTGHYKLHLENPAEHSVAEQLLIIDAWEASVSRNTKRADTSQSGTRSQIRNARYEDQALAVGSMSEWVLPDTDYFEFDYASCKRPPLGATILSEDAFASWLRALQRSPCMGADQVAVIRRVSDMLYLSSVQLRHLLRIYKSEELRLEIVVLFYTRIVDPQNDKLFRVRLDSATEMEALFERLGHCLFFPTIQPEQAKLSFNFTWHDERLALWMLCQLNGKEGKGSMRDITYTTEDGVVDRLLLGPPKAWEVLDKIPKAGKLQCRYDCAAEDRKFPLRKQFLETYGYWRISANEEDVMWWSDLSDAPAEVVDLLEFCIAHYETVWDVFDAIIEEGGTHINMKEFEEAVKVKLGCTKFDGANQRNRIATIFRYLDPHGEGALTRSEWGVLVQLWDEVQLSIHEFTRFLLRKFGSLDKAWEDMKDARGTIKKEDWVSTCEGMGFFGPLRFPFGFLDQSDSGEVTYDHFLRLQAFPAPASPRLQMSKTLSQVSRKLSPTKSEKKR